MPTLGLDIGGANLKAATSDGRAAAISFPLWKTPERLAGELTSLRDHFPNCDRLAVTMTGELADCFATKAEGVSRILDAVETMADRRTVMAWTTTGRFVTLPEARELWMVVAAANWHALATWSGRQFAPHGEGLLVDIGSTTCDIIPLRDGVPVATGRTDLERLLSGELVYTGVRRTPLCAVTGAVELRGTTCPLAAELFATMLDAYLITGRIPPDESDCDTADGRPATVERAYDRLARMLCCDRTELSTAELRSLAEQLITAQSRQIQIAISSVLSQQSSSPITWLISGSGTFLAHQVLAEMELPSAAALIDLAARLSPAIAESACAYAVARLADDRRVCREL